jgi:mycothiol synthase
MEPIPQFFMRRPDLEGLPALALPMGYVLRPYQEGDGPSAAETLQQAFEVPWDEAKVLSELAANDFVKTMFVIVFEGKVVATASAAYGDNHPGSGYVHWVATHPAHAGKGLGYWASLATLHKFRELGYKDAVLNTDDFRFPAIKTYLKLGFQPEHIHESHPERWAKVLAQLG